MRPRQAEPGTRRAGERQRGEEGCRWISGAGDHQMRQRTVTNGTGRDHLVVLFDDEPAAACGSGLRPVQVVRAAVATGESAWVAPRPESRGGCPLAAAILAIPATSPACADRTRGALELMTSGGLHAQSAARTA